MAILAFFLRSTKQLQTNHYREIYNSAMGQKYTIKSQDSVKGANQICRVKRQNN